MPRWNAIVDGSGTPPDLEASARDPVAFEAKLRALGADLDNLEVYWDDFSWNAYVTADGTRPVVEKFLRRVEAKGVKVMITSEEKKGRPGSRAKGRKKKG